MINYSEIIEQLDINDIKNLLTQLDIPFEESETYLVMPTACHNEDLEEASWKLYYYKDTHIFYCYTNCEGMSIFTFLKNFYETRNIEYDWYKDIFLVVKDCSNYEPLFGLNVYKSDIDKYKIHQPAPLQIYDKTILLNG